MRRAALAAATAASRHVACSHSSGVFASCGRHMMASPLSQFARKAFGSTSLQVVHGRPSEVAVVPRPSETFKVAVVGLSGHGKSTFLNTLADEELFEEGSSGASCTQKVSRKEFLLVDSEDGQVKVEATDTMGFPDTNPEKAIDFFDKVVATCNQPLNAILWVIKPERATPDLLHKYKVLMREFNQAKPPIVVIVNGTKNYGRTKNKDEKERKKAVDFKNYFEFAADVKNAADIQVSKILVATDVEELGSSVKGQLVSQLMGTTPRSSNMKTYKALEQEVSEAEKDGTSAELEAEKIEAKLNKASRDVEDAKDRLVWMKNSEWCADLFLGQALKGWVTWCLGFDFDTVIAHQWKTLDDLRAKEEALRGESLKLLGDIDSLRERAKDTQEAFARLRKALCGDGPSS